MFQRVLLDFVLKTFGLGAENEARTRDPDLGKVVLYQLSYFRICNIATKCNESEEKETRTPTTQLSLPPQSSASTNSATSPYILPKNKEQMH